MGRSTATVTIPTGWAVFWGTVRLGVVIFIGFHAPWYVTTLAVLSQFRFERRDGR
jgi:hypothetical protein